MQKQQITKPDGRYIIFYTFEEDEASDQPRTVEPVPEPEEREEQQ